MRWMSAVMRPFAVLLFFALTLIGPAARAQFFYSWTEYGFSGGGSQYFGDLNDHYGLHYIRPVGGLFMRMHLSPYIAIRTSLSYTNVGYDDRFNNNAFEQTRNLSFRSNIMEGAVQAEFNFTRFSTGELGSRFTPYLTGGIGAFYFNPYTDFQDRRYYLRTIGTEGQNLPQYADRKYGSFAMCIPIGLGFKYWVRPGFNIGAEIADRLTTTDYLDDVSTTYVGSSNFPNDPLNPNPSYYLQDRSIKLDGSGTPLGREGKQRGNSQTKDQYLYFQINVSIQLKVYKCPGWLKQGALE